MFGTFKHDQQGRSRSPARDEGVRPTQKLMTTDDRYSRQILFAGIGEEGQRLIRKATVAVAGCGALGAFQAGALARAGIGKLILIDRDYVEWSNLQRQWLYDEDDARAGLPKAVAAARHIARINSEVTIEAQAADLAPDNAAELLEGVDLVLDGTDNFETRYLINDWCVDSGVPWIYGGAVGSYGLSMPIIPMQTACFECVYPEPPVGAQPTCETAGVLNSITALVAAWQTASAMKILSGHGLETPAKITVFDDSLVFNDAPAFAVGKTARPVPIDARTTCPHDS